MKNISILGSTGSIGTQTLDVIRKNRDKFKVVGLSANKDIETLYNQIIEFSPEAVGVVEIERAKRLKEMVKDKNIEVYSGIDSLDVIATLNEADMILTSVVGMVGLKPTLSAIKKGKDIALANKETLVAGGGIIKRALKSSKSKMLPVDSEHCAIFQCLQCSKNNSELEKIILTASGGPFRGKKRSELLHTPPEAALKHPNWKMGRKITIDSATLMNKGLEVIEAHWLFDVGFDKIDVIIQPESIIHSMVEFVDGSIIAQLGAADMRNPISYALEYPNRLPDIVKKLDLTEVGKITFEMPDVDTFRSLRLAYEAGREGGTMPVVLNGANEAAVDLYLRGIIGFLDIPDLVEEAMLKHVKIENPEFEDILNVDSISRKIVYNKAKVVQG